MNGKPLGDKMTMEGADAPSGSKKGLLFGLVAAFVLGGGGFYATYSGMIGGKSDPSISGQKTTTSEKGAAGAEFSLPEVAFIKMEPLIVSLTGNVKNRYLRFNAQLEVRPEFEAEVTLLLPRVLDVLNGYLRAVDSRDIESSATLGRMRAQMLRRIQVVTGQGRVRDLLITEFVLN